MIRTDYSTSMSFGRVLTVEVPSKVGEVGKEHERDERRKGSDAHRGMALGADGFRMKEVRNWFRRLMTLEAWSWQACVHAFQPSRCLSSSTFLTISSISLSVTLFSLSRRVISIFPT